jgi:hypothetical protein
MLLAGLAAVAVVAAPAADARRTCHDTGGSTICQTNGSVSVKAIPTTTAPPAIMPMMPWLGMPGRRR